MKSNHVVEINAAFEINAICVTREEYFDGKKNIITVPVADWASKYAMKDAAEIIYRLKF